jgi:hypothetical protein
MDTSQRGEQGGGDDEAREASEGSEEGTSTNEKKSDVKKTDNNAKCAE